MRRWGGWIRSFPHEEEGVIVDEIDMEVFEIRKVEWYVAGEVFDTHPIEDELLDTWMILPQEEDVTLRAVVVEGEGFKERKPIQIDILTLEL